MADRADFESAEPVGSRRKRSRRTGQSGTGEREGAHFTDADWFDMAVKGIRAACERGGREGRSGGWSG